MLRLSDRIKNCNLNLYKQILQNEKVHDGGPLNVTGNWYFN